LPLHPTAFVKAGETFSVLRTLLKDVAQRSARPAGPFVKAGETFSVLRTLLKDAAQRSARPAGPFEKAGETFSVYSHNERKCVK